MVIEPRRVAPGYARRWSREALELVGRSFHTLFALALTTCGLTWVLEQAHLVVLTPFLLAWALGAAVEIVSISDNHVLRVSDLPGVFLTAARELFYEIRISARYITGILVFAALLFAWSAMQPPLPRSVPADLSDPLVWLFSEASPLTPAAMMLFLAASLQRYTLLDLGGLRHPLRRQFGLDEAGVRLVLRQAADKNSQLSLQFALTTRLLMVIAIGGLPVLTPFLMCFMPALVYVAFREIFVDDKGNRKPAKQTSTQLALEGMSS